MVHSATLFFRRGQGSTSWPDDGYNSYMAMHSVADAKNQLSSLIDRAISGETVVITRHGTPVVELTTVGDRGRPMTPDDLEWLRRRRVGRRVDANAGQFLSDMRDEDDERLLRR